MVSLLNAEANLVEVLLRLQNCKGLIQVKSLMKGKWLYSKSLYMFEEIITSL